MSRVAPGKATAGTNQEREREIGSSEAKCWESIRHMCLQFERTMNNSYWLCPTFGKEDLRDYMLTRVLGAFLNSYKGRVGFEEAEKRLYALQVSSSVFGMS